MWLVDNSDRKKWPIINIIVLLKDNDEEKETRKQYRNWRSIIDTMTINVCVPMLCNLNNAIIIINTDQWTVMILPMLQWPLTGSNWLWLTSIGCQPSIIIIDNEENCANTKVTMTI